MHITTSEYQINSKCRLNEGRSNDRNVKENSFKVAQNSIQH